MSSVPKRYPATPVSYLQARRNRHENRKPRPRLESHQKNMFLTCVTDIEAFFKHTDARMEHCGAMLLTSTTVEVRRSAHADSLVEVEAAAITD
jgi:hypothetical protein